MWIKLYKIPLIFSFSTTSLSGGISESRSSGAHLFLAATTHDPRLTELLWILYYSSIPRSKVVFDLGIKITTKTAQLTPVWRRHGYFKEANTIPMDLDPDSRINDYTVVRTIDVQLVSYAIGNVHLLSVHLHSHFLAQIYFQIADLQHICMEHE